MSVQEEIESFFEWVDQTRRDIDELPEHFRRILLLSLLDTLARCAFPEVRGKQRFVHLIDSHSEWEHKDRVSLTQLRYLLDGTPAEDHRDVKREVQDRVSRWPDLPMPSILRPHQADPLGRELEGFKCEKLVEKARYASLLWTMRNFANHELRTPGQGWRISTDNSTPYYHHLGLTGPSAGHSWELYIPPEVISTCVANCSNQLRRRLEENGVNPYDSFDFGSSWFPD